MAYYILKSYKLKIKPLQVFEALKNERGCFFLDSSLNPHYTTPLENPALKGGDEGGFSIPCLAGRQAPLGTSGLGSTAPIRLTSFAQGVLKRSRRMLTIPSNHPERSRGINPGGLHLGRYSILGIDPFYILESKNQDPLPRLREILGRYRISIPRSDIPFLGGAVGYLAYDLGFVLEKKLKNRPKPASSVPDSSFGFYNTAIIIDHFKQLLYIFSAGFPETTCSLAKSLCDFNFKKIHRILCRAASLRCSNRLDTLKPGKAELKSNFTKEDYILSVKKAKEYIRKGDIYQVNLSQEFNARTDLSAFQIYKRLRSLSPSYFSAYFDCQDYQILSSSPETFLRLDGDTATTRPMKGTRPRSENKLKDRKLKRDLLESAKDKAELVMIVDLERNDLGRVCSYDSIEVEALRQLEGYSTVFQTTATVSGRMHKNKDRIDLIRACFPGGSITGCPKIRAMEIIEELEPVRRSIYTGSLGYLSFSGTMELNILIRTILKKDDELYFSSGGGIVADSDPQDEYEETLVKAKAMTEAINAL